MQNLQQNIVSLQLKKAAKQLILKIKPFKFFCLMLLLFASYTKTTVAQIAPVSDAAGLKSTLNYIRNNVTHNCSTQVVVRFVPDAVIDLGQLNSWDLPLIIDDGIILEGDYAVNDIRNDGRSHGTTITMPYLYRSGYSCTQNLQNLTGNIKGAAFYMNDGCEFRKINLKGPRTDNIGWRWSSFPNMCLGLVNPACTTGCAFNSEDPMEGVSTGIQAYGNNIAIKDCEISASHYLGLLLKRWFRNRSPGSHRDLVTPTREIFFLKTIMCTTINRMAMDMVCG